MSETLSMSTVLGRRNRQKKQLKKGPIVTGTTLTPTVTTLTPTVTTPTPTVTTPTSIGSPPLVTVPEENLRRGSSLSDTGVGSSGSSSPTSSSSPSVDGRWTDCSSTLKRCPCSILGRTYHVDYLNLIKDEGDDDSEVEGRIRLLLLQNAKAKLLLKKNHKYSRILTLQGEIRAQQLHILRKAEAVNGMFVNGMEAVLYLGHCPLLLQGRTDKLRRGLIDVHDTIQGWDDKLEGMISNSKDKHSALNKVFKRFTEKFGKDLDALSVAEFWSLYEEMDDISELLGDEEGLTELFGEIELTLDINKEWDLFKDKVELQLYAFETEFADICLEFGIRPPNPKGSCPPKKDKKRPCPHHHRKLIN